MRDFRNKYISRNNCRLEEGRKKKLILFLIDSFCVPPPKACVSLLWSFPGSEVLQLIAIYITNASFSQGQ